MSKRIITLMMVAVMALTTLVGCGGKETGTGTVTTDGSTSMEMVIGALGEAFQNETGISVTYNPTGSSAGIKAVLEGRCDIGLSSRDLKASENEIELRRYEKEYHELGRKGKILEKIELSRKVLDLYPRNYQWMLNLAYGLISYGATSEQRKYREEHKFVEEAISLCERILEDCTVDSIRHSAIQILCYEYPNFDKKEAAIKLAEDMPNMLICKEMLLSHIYSGTERLKQEQNNLRFMLHFCCSILYLMACDKDLRQGLTVDQRIKMLDTAISLNKTMLYDDEDENLYNNQLSLYYLMIAKLYCQKNESDMVIKNLLLSEKCAINYDSASNLGEQNYNSIYFSKLTWNPQNISTNCDKTLKEQLLYNLDDTCFVDLAEKEEFKNLKNRLKKL